MQTAHALDACKRKHRGSPASNAAYKRVAPSAASFRQAIWFHLRKHPLGLTCREIAAHFKSPMHCVSGRITELKQADRVMSTGMRRDGGTVLMVVNPNRDLFAGVPSTEAAQSNG